MALKGKFKRNNTNFKVIKSVLSHLRCSKLFKNFLDFPDAGGCVDCSQNDQTMNECNNGL